MKTLKTSSLILILIFLVGLAAIPVKASEPTLADQLNTAINTVEWSSPTSWMIPHFSLIFNGQGNYDAAVPTIPDFKTLIQAKRMAEIDGAKSPILSQNVVQALNNQQMSGQWPKVKAYIMSVYWRFLVFAYDYAVELGADTSKWNMGLAFQEYLRCWQNDHDFLWFNPENGVATDYMNRYYDENAQVLSMFLKFYQTGVSDALDYARQMWTHLCTDHWSGSYFPYTGKSGQVECEAGSFAEIIAELYATNGYNLPNFPDYILQDLDYKFLSGGDWSAKLWSPGAYVVRHAESNPEKRLENTVSAWVAMHSYYCLMNSAMQSEFISLLSGSPKAWQGIVDYSGMYNNGRFSWRNNGVYGDVATCEGAMILFLNGIVPDSGSLAIPVIDETYEDWCSMFPASEFRFDYGSRTIRIPVWKGQINFIFGTDAASYTFPSNGVFEVQFSSDWNAVTNARKVSMLDSRFKYIKPQSNLPVPYNLILPHKIKANDATPVQSTEAPAVSVNSPQNKTYETNNIPLTFKVNESVSWVGYSLDGQKNVTISGNAALAWLPIGPHSLSVSVKDSAENTGTSETIYFTVAQEPVTKPNPELFSTEWIAATIIGFAVVVAAAFLVYFKKNKKK